MFRRTYETSATPSITVRECLGDLVIRGDKTTRVDLRLRGEDEDADLSQEGEVLTLTSRVDCTLTCPIAATVTVHVVRGDLRVKGLEGTAAIGDVYGDVVLQGVGHTTIEQVYGGLNAYQITGELKVQALAGDAKVRDVRGKLFLGQVGSDLKANAVRGGLVAEQVGSDVLLEPPFPAGAIYRVKAGSDLRVRIPSDASLRLALRAGGRVRSRIPDLILKEIDGKMKGVVGTGEASLEAQVGGGIFLSAFGMGEGTMDELSFDFTANLEGLGMQIEARIAEAMAEMETRLEESLGRFDSDRIHSQVSRAQEQALRTAEREAERARLRMERAERRWKRVSGRQAREKSEAATDEERMRVLRMVEEGKITPDQAADLLAALEGW